MSWDAHINLVFDRKLAPLDRLRLLQEKGAGYFRLDFLGDDYLARPLTSRESPLGETLGVDAFAPPKEGARHAAASGWAEVKRCLPRDDTGSTEFDYRTVTTCLSERYRWPGIAKPGLDAVYDAGDYKHYFVPLGGEAALLNIALLAEEIGVLAEAGLLSARGMDASRSDQRDECWLIFHSAVEGFAQDLMALGYGPKRLDHGAVLAAAGNEAPLAAAVHATPFGLVIVAQQGSAGRLRAFYARLGAIDGGADG